MTTIEIKIDDHGLMDRLRRYPEQYNRAINQFTEAGLYALQEHVPPYPPQPTTTSYRRTGMLGRSLGVSMQGGRVGRSEIFQVRKVGGYHEGRFGTNLFYAEHVIGDNQARAMGHWWQMKDVPQRAMGKINALLQATLNALARFIEGRGG